MSDKSPTSPTSLDEALRLEEELRLHEAEMKDEIARLHAEIESLRHQSEKARLEHEAIGMLISAIDQCSESIFFTDVKGRILYVNRSFEKNSGYTRDELLGQTPRILKSGVHPPEFYEEMWSTILAGGIWRSRVTNRRKDGTLYHEEARVAPVRNDDGEITSFVSVKSDISELLKSQRALEEMNAELSRSNLELQQFAYVASHDLQEPLRAVSSCMQLLSKHYSPKLDDRANEFISHSVDACRRMRDLIDGLLTLSRVQSMSNQLVPTDTTRIIEQACANLAHAIETSSATIDYESLPVVCAHPQMLIHLFQNLIGNALKFSDGKPPVVRVRAHRQGGDWIFSVEDEGIGIEPVHFERIFQLFQRLHTRDEYSGTGLGLAICQKIVDQHGGRIWVQSTPGKGSTFYFTLPALHDDADFECLETHNPCPQPTK